MGLSDQQKKSIKRKKKQRKSKAKEEQQIIEEEMQEELEIAETKQEETTEEKPQRKSWYIVKERKNRKKSDEPDEEDRYHIRLSTKIEKFAITQASISVKQNIRYEGLNGIVRSMIQQAGVVEEPIPYFQFMVDGEILPAQTSLHELLNTEEVNPEKLIEIEYYQSDPVPQPHDNLEHDEWIGALHCMNGYLLTGSYDNTVQIWMPRQGELALGKAAHKLTIDAHDSYVKAVKWLKHDGDNFTFVSSSMDQKSHIWTWNPKENKATKISTCDGHELQINCIGTYDHKYFMTGSWDCTVKVWDSEKTGSEAVPTEQNGETVSKKKKVNNTQFPKMSLTDHTQSVVGVSWMSNTKAISASMDHSLIVWDVNRGVSTRTITTNMPFLALEYCSSKNVAIGACYDRHIRLYDVRADTRSTNIAQSKFAACKKWVSSLSKSAGHENLFMSGCQDEKENVNVWDIRSQKAPLNVLMGHTDQVLAVDWSDPNFLVSGGADQNVHVFSILHDGVDIPV